MSQIRFPGRGTAKHTLLRQGAAAAAAVTALLATAGAAGAAPADVAVVRDPVGVGPGNGLAGVIVYSRFTRPHAPRYPWIRVVGGKRRVAHLPTHAGYMTTEALGRDAAGRIVMPYMTARATRTGPKDPRWWLYDVRRDRSRPMRGLPSGRCTPDDVAIWRSWVAYQRRGAEGCRYGVFLRRGSRRTKRVSALVSSDHSSPLLLRGRTLAMISGSGDSAFSLWQLVVDGHVCPARIPSASGDADSSYTPLRAWLNGHRLSWWMEGQTDHVLVLETTLSGDCTPPTTTAAYPDFTGRPILIDGTTLYHVVGRAIYRTALPAPSSAPAANQAAGNALALPSTVPQTVWARIGYATHQAGDPQVHASWGPPGTATRTLWYAFRPAQAEELTVAGSGGPFAGLLSSGAMTLYDDTSGTPVEIPAHPDNFERDSATFRADPAHHYLIGIGCSDPTPCWAGFSLEIRPGATAVPGGG